MMNMRIGKSVMMTPFGEKEIGRFGMGLIGKISYTGKTGSLLGEVVMLGHKEGITPGTRLIKNYQKRYC